MATGSPLSSKEDWIVILGERACRESEKEIKSAHGAESRKTEKPHSVPLKLLPKKKETDIQKIFTELKCLKDNPAENGRHSTTNATSAKHYKHDNGKDAENFRYGCRSCTKSDQVHRGKFEEGKGSSTEGDGRDENPDNGDKKDAGKVEDRSRSPERDDKRDAANPNIESKIGKSSESGSKNKRMALLVAFMKFLGNE